MENWVHFVKSKRNYSEPTRQSEVCGEHFTNKNYTNRFAHLTDNSFNRLEERWFIEEENRSRNRHNVERFLCAHYISAGQTSLLLVPEEGWFGQPKYSAHIKTFLRCAGFCLYFIHFIHVKPVRSPLIQRTPAGSSFRLLA